MRYTEGSFFDKKYLRKKYANKLDNLKRTPISLRHYYAK
jgi:hypothetical protein